MLITTETISGTVEERDVNAVIQIVPQTSGDVEINVLRERKKTLNGVLVGTPTNRQIRKMLSEIVADTVTLANGKQVSAAELAEALEKFTDLYA